MNPDITVEDECIELPSELGRFRDHLTSRLAELRRRLVDTSRRNRMLAFPLDSSRRDRLNIIDAGLDAIHDLLDAGKGVPLLPLEEPLLTGTPDDEYDPKFVAALQEAKRTDPSYRRVIGGPNKADEAAVLRAELRLRSKVRLTLGMPPVVRILPNRAAEIEEHARSLRIDPARELAPDRPVQKGGLQTLLFPDRLAAHARSVMRGARLAEQESGSNMLYAIHGFLAWREADSSEIVLRAPLLVQPLRILREKRAGREVFLLLADPEEETSVNPVLGLRLDEFGLTLPRFEPEKEKPIESFLSQVERAVESKPEWEVERRSVVSLLSFDRIAIWIDSDSAGWPQGRAPIDHPIINRLILGRSTPGISPFGRDVDPDEPEIRAAVPILVHDADATQVAAVADATIDDLVVIGPPGTGKSQTIVNILANAAYRGERVLFVAEKLAALEVVQRRLESAGLSPFCLELTSRSARPAQVCAQIRRRLQSRPMPEARSGHGQNRDRPLMDLRSYLEAITSSSDGDVPLFQRIFEGVALLDRLPTAERLADRLRTSIPAHHLRDDARRLLEGLAERLQDIDREGQAAWRWFQVRQLLGYEASDLVDLLRRVQKVIQRLQDLTDLPASLLGMDRSRLAESLLVLEQWQLPTEEIGRQVFAVGLHATTRDLAVRWFSAASARELAHQRLISLGISGTGSYATADLREAARLAASLQIDMPAEVAQRKRLIVQAEAIFSKLQGNITRITRAAGLGTEASLGEVLSVAVAISAMEGLSPRAAQTGYLPNSALAPQLADLARRAEDVQAERKVLSGIVDLRQAAALDLPTISKALAAPGLLGFLRTEVKRAKSAVASIVRIPLPPGQMAALIQRIEALFAEERETDRERSRLVGGGPDLALAEMAERAALRGRIESTASARGLDPEPAIAWYAGSSPANRTATIPLAPVAASILRLAGLAPSVLLLPAERASQQLAANSDALDALLRLLPSAPAAGLPFAQWEQAAAALDSRRAAEAEQRELLAVCPALGAIPQLDAAPVERYQAALAEIKASFARLPDLEPLLQDLAQAADPVHDLQRWQKAACSAGTALVEIARTAEEIDPLVQPEQPFSVRSATLPIGELAQRVDRACAHERALMGAALFNAVRRQAEAHGLVPFLEQVETGVIPAADLVPLFDLAAARADQHRYFAENRDLALLDGVKLARWQDSFRKADRAAIEVGRAVLAEKLHQRPVLHGQGYGPKSEWTEEALLVHEAHKQRKFLPLRRLFAQAGQALGQLQPIMLASPLYVSRFLPRRPDLFDLVVVDEASQMRVEDLLGSAARGKRLVVVGDPRQLPPTDFFSRVGAEDDDEDPENDAPVETSVLELCDGQRWPRRELRWHYRSRHHSLMSFGNRAFYENNLIIQPSPIAPHAFLGVELVEMRGCYQNRCNLPEAEAVVAAARRVVAERPSLSLGIVAVNRTQADAIEDLLDKAALEDRALETYRAHWEGKGEPLFVKNLENVQGDERDVILVSLTYGPSADGKFVARFGPIAKAGGERRLNVLFSRARDKLVGFSSIPPERVAGLGTGRDSGGVAALRDWLQFARNGGRDPAHPTGIGHDSPFEAAVAGRLRRKGWEVEAQVGAAGYRIDLAVVDPERPGRYLLGIECDGAAFHRTRSARDRDRLRQEVLEGLGWTIVRVWSTDWYRDPDSATETLQTAIQQALLKAREPDTRDRLVDHQQILVPEPSGQALADVEAVEPKRVPTSEPEQGLTQYDPRTALRRLRDRIMEEFPGSEPERCLLRETMIDEILACGLDDPDEFCEKIPLRLRENTDHRQLRFLTEVCVIVEDALTAA